MHSRWSLTTYSIATPIEHIIVLCAGDEIEIDRNIHPCSAAIII